MPENKNVILEVQDLKMKFGKLEVLKGVTTTIRRGEVIVVIGASGAGKSTFLRCLNLFGNPDERATFSLRAKVWFTPDATSTICASAWAWCSSSSTCSTT